LNVLGLVIPTFPLMIDHNLTSEV